MFFKSVSASEGAFNHLLSLVALIATGALMPDDRYGRQALMRPENSIRGAKPLTIREIK